MQRSSHKAQLQFMELITTLFVTAQAVTNSQITIARQQGHIAALFHHEPFRADCNPYKDDAMLARVYCRAWLTTVNPDLAETQIEKCLDELHPWGGVNHG